MTNSWTSPEYRAYAFRHASWRWFKFLEMRKLLADMQATVAKIYGGHVHQSSRTGP